MKRFLLLTFCITVWLLCLFLIIVRADDVSFLAGGSTYNASNSHDTAYTIRYNADLNKYFSASVGYINEGHVFNHKRDGLAIQGWGNVPVVKDRLLISLGIGPYLYMDTRPDNIDRGVALVTTGALTYNVTSRWFARGEISRVVASGNGDADLFFCGVGYRF